MKKLRKTQAALNLPTLTLEGGLFLPDQLEKAALGSAQWQTEADYGTPKGLKLKDDYSRAFQIACAQWKHFANASGPAPTVTAQNNGPLQKCVYIPELDVLAGYNNHTEGVWLYRLPN